MKMGRPPIPIEKRFWPRVIKGHDNECWLWIGAVSAGGYGRLETRTRLTPGEKAAHRVSWRMHKGDIPAGLMVCHRCDNPLCVNPKHLFLGTAADNMADKVAKGRQSRTPGEANGSAKLSREIVDKIRVLHKSGGYSQSKLAAQFGISQTGVSAIVRRIVWRHV